MNLRDLIDLEAQIAVDEKLDDETLRARDRTAFAALEVDAAPDGGVDRHTFLSAWLAHLRTHGHSPDLGRRVLIGYRWLSYLLAAAGLASGWSLAYVLLRYDQGRPPINVGVFLAVVVGLQLLSLVALLFTLPLLRAFPDLPVIGDLRAGLRGLSGLLERLFARADAQLSSEQREAWRVASSRLRMRGELYRPVEQWLLLEKGQLFGLMLNIGILAAALRLVLFSDLAFAWSTTAEFVDAPLVHRITSALAWPWAALLPDAVPSLELVEKTQYFRLEGGGFRVAAPEGVFEAEIVGGWWRFLVAATAVYGLLPRLLLWIVARVARGRALARVPLDTADVERVLRRLRVPLVETRPATLAPQGAEPALAPVAVPSGALPGQVGGPCAIVLWRDLPAEKEIVTRAVRASFGYDAARLDQAGGVDFAADERLVAALAAAGDPVIVLAEGWEAPDKSIRHFLSALRAASPSGAKRFVALVEEIGAEGWRPASAGDVKIWRDRLSLLEDPYLLVEPLEDPRS